jgi:hypothetical protein
MTEKCIRLHNGVFNHLCTSPNIVGVIKTRRMTWVSHLSFIVARIDAYRFSLGNMGGKRILGRNGRRWGNNIKIDLQAVGSTMDWIDLGQNRNRWRLL